MTSQEPSLDDLERSLGHRFEDRALLERALTHASYANERKDPSVRNNEPLEFLGDAILGFLVAELLHRADPDGHEGLKSRRRAVLVRARSLARRAEIMGIPRYLRLDRNEERTGGRAKASLWSDAYEAVLAAIYLDGGLAAARRFVDTTFREERDAGMKVDIAVDFKSDLQERLQAEGRERPSYRLVLQEGLPHARTFRMACEIDGVVAAEGVGRSKKQAQQAAAEAALQAMVPPPRQTSES